MNLKHLICVLVSCVFLCVNGAPQETETALLSKISIITSSTNTTTTNTTTTKQTPSRTPSTFYSTTGYPTGGTYSQRPTTYDAPLPTPTGDGTYPNYPSRPRQGIFAFALWAKIVIPLVVIGALGFGVYCCRSHRKQKRRRRVGMLRSLDAVEEKEAQGKIKGGAGVEVVRDVDGGGMQVDRIQSYPERDDGIVRPHGS